MCVRFLKPGMSEAYHQKAIDLDGPPTLPKPIQLLRARGVLEVEEALDEPADKEDKSDKDLESGMALGDHGDA